MALGHPARGPGSRRGHGRVAALALGLAHRPPGGRAGGPRGQPLHLRQADDGQPAAGLRLAPELRRRPLGDHGGRAGARRRRGGRAGPEPPAGRGDETGRDRRRDRRGRGPAGRAGDPGLRPLPAGAVALDRRHHHGQGGPTRRPGLRGPGLRRQLDDPGRARPDRVRRGRSRGPDHLQRRPRRRHPGPARALGPRRGRLPGGPRRGGPRPLQLRPQRQRGRRAVRPRRLRRRPPQPGRPLRAPAGALHPPRRPVPLPQRAPGPRGGLGRAGGMAGRRAAAPARPRGPRGSPRPRRSGPVAPGPAPTSPAR